MILDSPEFDSRLLGFVDPHRKGQWRYRDIPLLASIEELPPDRFQVGRGSEFVMANEQLDGELSTFSVRPWPAYGGEADLQPSRALESIFSSRQVDTLVVAVEPEDSSVARAALAIAEQMGVTVCLIPELLASRKARIRTGFIHGLPTLTFRAVPDCRTRLFVKQAVDLIGATVALVLTAPLMLVTAVAIKLESPGPIMFGQTRCGLNGRLFRMYKFRTMVNGAEKRRHDLADLNEMSGPVFKIKNDPRVTRVGRFLRKTSIDELPQLINILSGEMSLVGPRPPLPSEVARYQPWQHRRLSVKPGITCLWQVNGRNRIDFEKWMKLDLEYIDHWSLWQDVKILARTVPAVLRTNGAS
jgi:exopolysaccharide biosynthesis polyprenyl glycosylphosphotransferase